jgi:uncharacterized phiE125 gp8 family phage protein
MSHIVTSIDYATLAAALLPAAKAHLRVDFDDDDQSIESYLAWAMGMVEAATEQAIGAATVDWAPQATSDGINTTMLASYPFPMQPVAAFTVKDSLGVDVTTQYQKLMTSLTLPPLLQRIDGAVFPVGTAVAFKAGTTDPGKLQPNIEAAIFRVMAMLYENRESISSISVEEMPLWMNDLLAGTWLPRA